MLLRWSSKAQTNNIIYFDHLHLLHTMCSLHETVLELDPGHGVPRYLIAGLSQYRRNGITPPGPQGCVQKSD